MFRLLDLLASTVKAARAEHEREPWTCPECGRTFPSLEGRRHRLTHRATIVSERPLVVELRCWDLGKDLGPALAELQRRWPGRKFQLLPGSYAIGMEGGGHKLRTVLAVEDDWTVPHDPFGPA